MGSRLGPAACGALMLMTSPLVLGDEDDDEDVSIDRTPVSCVSTPRIRRTKIVDDRTILFYMRGGRIYGNILGRDCPNLEREDRFAYQARGARLCSVDTIQVLPRFGPGFGFGASCPLGEFHPMTPEEADLLLLGPEESADPQNVVIRPIELPQDDASGSPDPGAESETPTGVGGAATPADAASGDAP